MSVTVKPSADEWLVVRRGNKGGKGNDLAAKVARLEAQMAAPEGATSSATSKHGIRRPAVEPGTTVQARFAGRLITCTVAKGDWTCKACGVPANRAGRTACFVCNTERPAPKTRKKAKKGPQKEDVVETQPAAVQMKSNTSTVPTVQPSPGRERMQQLLATVVQPSKKSYAAAAAAAAEAKEATAREIAAALKRQQQPPSTAPGVTTPCGGSAAAAGGTATATDERDATKTTLTTVTTMTTAADSSGSATTAPTTDAASPATDAELEGLLQLVARLVPSLSPVVEAVLVQRAAEAPLAGKNTIVTPTAATVETGTVQKTGTVDKRTPARKHADAVTKRGQSQAALASYEALVLKKNAEAAQRRTEILAEAQAFIDAAIADRDSAVACLDETEALWKVENDARLAELRAKVKEAEQQEVEAAAELAAAGDKAHEPPPPPEEPHVDDGDGSDAGSDDDDDDMFSVNGEGSTLHYEIGDVPPAVEEFREPPAFAGQLDEPTTGKLAAARRTLEHWVQQAVRIPLTPANLGLTAAEIRSLVGEDAWAASVPAGVIVADTDTLSGGVPGVLFTALLRLKLDSAAEPAVTEDAGEGTRATLKKAALSAASARSATKLVQRQQLKQQQQLRRAGKKPAHRGG